MSRSQQRLHSNLPPYTSRDKYRGVVYRPYHGRQNGKIQWGKRVRLADLDAPLSEIWKAFEELQAPDSGTLGWLLAAYSASPHYLTLSTRTRKDYERHKAALVSRRLPNGSRFGDAQLSAITKRSIRGYLDTATAPVQGNRQISYLKSAWNWGEERYDIPANPCLGVKPNKESPRDRYVTHLEYEKALSYAPEWLQIAMGLAYWCRARRAEVLAMTYEDVTEDGLIVNRLKNSMSEITVSDQVANLVERSKHLSEGSNHLVRNSNGKRVGVAGFNSAWRRLAVRMGDDHFHFHDLKAKGISDMKNEQWAGHRTKKALAVYQRRVRKIMPDYE